MKFYCVLIIALICSCSESNPNSVFEKKIYQHIDVAAMGMIEDLKIINVEKVNDTTFKATHTFTNPMINKEMKITRNYFFSQDGSAINNEEEISIEMKSQGEWVDAGF